MVRVCFMGTPEFARQILEQLTQEDVEIVGIVCQQDQYVGRKRVLTAPCVKEFALEHNIPVFQPQSIKEDYSQIQEWNPDIIITCAYGQFVPQAVLDIPRLGAWNVHASLLPQYRGGAPIQRAIMNGSIQTGITIMKMAKRMDAGDMVSSRAVDILEEYTYGDLEEILMKVARELLHDTLPSLLDESYELTPQDESKATFAPIITREDEKIDFHLPYRDVYNHIRGLIPRPVGYGLLEGKKIKFWNVEMTTWTTDRPDGEILPFIEDQLCVACRGRILVFHDIQIEGKKTCSAKDWKNGQGRNMIGKIIQ